MQQKHHCSNAILTQSRATTSFGRHRQPKRGVHDGLDISIFYPYPGTHIYENREKLGLRMLTDNWEDFASGDLPVCELENFSADQIMEGLGKARRMRDEYQLLQTITRKKREALARE